MKVNRTTQVSMFITELTSATISAAVKAAGQGVSKDTPFELTPANEMVESGPEGMTATVSGYNITFSSTTTEDTDEPTPTA